MSVLVYNGEKFQKSKMWYLIFVIVVASVFLLSLLNGNVVGAILIFFLLGAYFYYSTINNQVIKITIEKSQLIIGSKMYPWTSFLGFALEPYSVQDQRIKNIVFIMEKSHMIYSFDDSQEHVDMFVAELEMGQYIKRVGNYNQSLLERMSRKMKL